MAETEFYLDAMPGETRGIVVRDGHYLNLFIQRDTDRIERRPGTRLVGRVARVEPGIRAAFIDIGAGEPFGFLPMTKAQRLDVGAKLEVVVTNAPRESKGPMLRYLADASGEIRVVEAGPDVETRLKRLASGRPVVTGLAAVRASLEAEEEGLATRFVRPEAGLDLAVERTRALVAVDIDYAPLAGKDSRKAREAVNRLGLSEAQRVLSLKSLGGIVAVDLAGVNLHPDSVLAAAKQIFGDIEGAAFGPLSRFGVLQLSLPWSDTPLDERMRAPEAAPLAGLRRLNEAMLSRTDVAVWELACDPAWEAYLLPLVTQLGPRARLVADRPNIYSVREG